MPILEEPQSAAFQESQQSATMTSQEKTASEAQEKASSFSWLKVLAFALVTIAFFGTLARVLQGLITGDPFGLTFLNGDTLYLPNLYSDWVQGYDLDSWKLTPATFFFPEMFLYFGLKPFIERFDIALAVVSGIQLTSVAVLLGQLFHEFTPQYSRWKTTAVAMSAMVLQFAMMLSWQPLSANFRIFNSSVLVGYHVGLLVLMLLSSLLLVKALKAPSAKAWPYWVGLGGNGFTCLCLGCFVFGALGGARYGGSWLVNLEAKCFQESRPESFSSNGRRLFRKLTGHWPLC